MMPRHWAVPTVDVRLDLHESMLQTGRHGLGNRWRSRDIHATQGHDAAIDLALWSVERAILQREGSDRRSVLRRVMHLVAVRSVHRRYHPVRNDVNLDRAMFARFRV